MSKIGDLWIKLGLKKGDLEKGLKEAGSKTESTTEKMKKNWKQVTATVVAVGAAIRAFAKGFKTIADFEQANANLSTILGKTVDEMKDLTDAALALGRSTEYTASQVTELQTELAKLGFDSGQIKSMEGAVLHFATAVGTDLASAAAFTGSTLRGFGLTAEDTEEVLSALAVATNKSALSFSTLQSGLAIVMPVANSFGFSVKDTTALLGTLINAGFDASSAATATRNILLYLSDSGSKLNELLGTQVKTLPDLVKALKDLDAKGVSLNTTLEATDKRAVAAFNALLAGADSTMELRNALDDVDGELDRIANERLDTVSGSVKILQSAWEGFILSMSASKGVIKSLIELLTKFVNLANFAFFGNSRISSFKDEFSKKFQNAFDNGINPDQAVANEMAYWDNYFSKGEGSKRAKGFGKFLKRLSPNYASNGAYNDELYQAYQQAAAEWHQNRQNAGLEDMMGGFGDTSGVETTASDPFAGLFAKQKENAKTEYEKNVKAIDKWLMSQKADTASMVAQMEKQFSSAITTELDKEVEEIREAMEEMTSELDFSQFDSPVDWSKNMQTYFDILDRMKEATEQANQAIRASIVDGLSGSFDVLADAITGVKKLDAKSLFGALLQPVAEACKSIGELVMLEGLAMVGFKDSIKNPWTAIAAGAALMAAGALASSGISKAVSSVGGGAGTSSSGSAENPYSSAYSGELTIYVQGDIKGDSIAIAGSKTLSNWNR